MKHKTQDYKITAVKYYLQNDDSLDEVCKIFDCKKTSLRRWIIKYKKNKNKRKYAAKDLGISERTLYRKIKQYDLEEME